MPSVDGSFINDDFDLYLDRTGRTGTRTKAVGLGTYDDGIERQRPMLVIPNPLAARDLVGRVTLVHGSPNLGSATLIPVGTLTRSVKDGPDATFTCYRLPSHAAGSAAFATRDPFMTPTTRSAAVTKRGL